MNEKLNELFKTMQENPGLEVLFFVDNDEICDPGEYSYTVQKIKEIKVDYCFKINTEHTVIGKKDTINTLIDYYEYNRESAEKKFYKLIESGVIVKKIVVYLGA